MDIKELEYKEMALREEFKEKLEQLNIDGNNDYCTVKCIKTYGVLWHLTHQLLLAEKHAQDNKEGEAQRSYNTTAETMNVQATGLKMGGTK